MSKHEQKIEILHIVVRMERDPRLLRPILLRPKEVLLLCGKRYIDMDREENSWATFEEYLDEPLMEEKYAKEVLCEECKNHPDFILWTLANV